MEKADRFFSLVLFLIFASIIYFFFYSMFNKEPMKRELYQRDKEINRLNWQLKTLR